MCQLENIQGYNNFIMEWPQYHKISHILKYIKSYPQLLKILGDKPLLDSDELEQSQIDWVWLVSQFDNPIETEFFKPYWVPITKGEFEYFIDLSTPKLEIFKMHYFWMEPYHWYKQIVIKDISAFLSSVDLNSIDESDYEGDFDLWAKTQELFELRKQLGLDKREDSAESF